MDGVHGACRLTVTVTGNEGRPVYTAEINGVSQRLTGQTQLRDLIRQADQECATAGAELEVVADGIDPALIAAWRARVKPPVGP